MKSLRILLAAHSLAWRRLVYAKLKRGPEIKIVGEASDGLEAIRKAQELQPDLILLDISLSRLNGIDASLQIRRRAPASKILLVSPYNSLAILEAALGTGARGYLLKTDAESELLTAIETVIQGSYFVSKGVRDRVFSDNSNSDISARRTETPLLPATLKPRLRKHWHEVGFYWDDSLLLDRFARFVGTTLSGGRSAIFVGTESHRESVLQRLQAYGSDVVAAIEQRRYVQLDPAEALSGFMVDGMPDSNLFTQAVGSLIGSAAKAANTGYSCVSACGECAPLLLAQGNAKAAVRLEQLWDDFAKIHGTQIFCGYHLSSLDPEASSNVFQAIRTAHSGFYYS